MTHVALPSLIPDVPPNRIPDPSGQAGSEAFDNELRNALGRWSDDNTSSEGDRISGQTPTGDARLDIRIGADAFDRYGVLVTRKTQGSELSISDESITKLLLDLPQADRWSVSVGEDILPSGYLDASFFDDFSAIFNSLGEVSGNQSILNPKMMSSVVADGMRRPWSSPLDIVAVAGRGRATDSVRNLTSQPVAPTKAASQSNFLPQDRASADAQRIFISRSESGLVIHIIVASLVEQDMKSLKDRLTRIVEESGDRVKKLTFVAVDSLGLSRTLIKEADYDPR